MSMKSIKTLVGDISCLLESPWDHEVDETLVEEFGESVKELLRNKLLNRPKQYGNGNALRMSSMGNPDRQLWYKHHMPEKAEPMGAKTYLKFLYGDMVEELILFLAKASGHEVTEEQRDVEIDGVSGHIDCIIDGLLVDVKSASPFGFKKFKHGTLADNDSFGYIDQLGSYLYSLQNNDSLKVKKQGAFLAVDKVTGDMVLDLHNKTDKNYSKVIEHKKEILAKDKPPPRCYFPEPDGKSGNMKLNTNCSYCAFKHECHPGLRTFLYSSGPRYLTHVVKTPDVYEVKDSND